MKEHILREMVNELRGIAEKYHAHGCLRQLILVCVTKWQEEDRQWQEKHGNAAGDNKARQ